ncbi:MAG: hypothetical protein JW883_12580 [Deltaproteobacteria bacterium]|nr:hypothetical protein [Deltaproteobacteria bacterium]
MYKKFAIGLALVCVFAFAGAAVAAPPFGAPWMISYDGYLQQTVGPQTLQADTLIVVTNSHPSRNMGVWIEVFDKYGVSVYAGTFYNGGGLLSGNILPGNQWCWITLGMVVPRATVDPWGFAAGEKFSFRIYTAPSVTAPVVEVKQVVYSTPTEIPPGELIWQSQYFKTWSEAALGGLNGTGVVKAP